MRALGFYRHLGFRDEDVKLIKLLVHPLVVGHGKRLFADEMEVAALKLVENKAFRSGVALLRYQPDGKA